MSLCKTLKIKDNVDLKELEKFGFEEGYQNGPCFIKSLSGTEGTHGFISIKAEHKINGLDIGDAREIHCVYVDSYCFSIEFNEFLNTMYDLIKANLVEKFED